MFCPECGKPLANTANESEQRVAVDSKPLTTEKSTGFEIVGSQEIKSATAPVKVEEAATEPAGISKSKDNRIASRSSPGKVERTRERLQRASNVARGALEDNVKRVEKIRHVSSAMLEEASYDPSLRFVLVALALFVIFLVLLLLSKVMG